MKTTLSFLSIVLLAVPLGLLTPPETPAQDRNQPSPAPAAGGGRQAISNRLDRIRLDTVAYDGLPLAEVVANLKEEAKKRDTDKKGINFMINPTAPPESEAPGVTPREQVDINSVIIRIRSPLTDVRLADVLDAVVKVADRPIRFTIEDYGVVFSLRGPEAERNEEAGFAFPGGTPYEFLNAVQQQFKVDWVSVAEVPREMADVRIPRLRIPPGSLGPVSRRPAGDGEPLAALVSLYNQLGDQKTELGRLLVKGDLAKPSVVMFVPDKSIAEAQPRMKVKAFSIFGIDDAERAKLQEDIDRARVEAIQYAEKMHGSSGARNLVGMVAIHNDTSLLVATGPEAYVDMVDSIVSACQTKARAMRPGNATTNTPGK